MRGGDLSQPLPRPRGGQALPHRMALSDAFSAPLLLGSEWTFFRPAADEAQRFSVAGGAMRLRITNRRHIVSIHTSGDQGQTWQRFDRGMEVSGYHHNVRGGFLALKPGLYAAGSGTAIFRDFRYTALDE